MQIYFHVILPFCCLALQSFLLRCFLISMFLSCFSPLFLCVENMENSQQMLQVSGKHHHSSQHLNQHVLHLEIQIFSISYVLIKKKNNFSIFFIVTRKKCSFSLIGKKNYHTFYFHLILFLSNQYFWIKHNSR